MNENEVNMFATALGQKKSVCNSLLTPIFLFQLPGVNSENFKEIKCTESSY